MPWWGLASSAATPVLLTAGWVVAGSLQPPSFDPVRQSVSTLAAAGAPDRWVMSLAFAAVAACYIATAVALRPAARAGRVVLVAAGAAGILVALSPEPLDGGFSLTHAVWATAGFGLLAAWPTGAIRRGDPVPWGLRPAAAILAVAVVTGLLCWFVIEVIAGGAQIGLAERITGEAQALWPLLVVISCRRAARQPAAVRLPGGAGRGAAAACRAFTVTSRSVRTTESGQARTGQARREANRALRLQDRAAEHHLGGHAGRLEGSRRHRDLRVRLGL